MLRKSQEKQWDSIAACFSAAIHPEKTLIMGPSCSRVLLKYASRTSGPIKCLDYGGGDGFLLLQVWQQTGIPIDYYDICLPQQELAQRYLSDVTPRVRFLSRFDLSHRQYDFIMCNHVVNVMESIQELTQLYTLLTSLLAPQGVVLLTLNHPDYVSERHHIYHYMQPAASTPFGRLADNDSLIIQIHNSAPKTGTLHFVDIWWFTRTLVEHANKAGLTLVERIDLRYPEQCEFPSYLQLVFRNLKGRNP